MIFIYYLTKQNEDIPFYIGKTKNIKNRLIEHKYKKRNYNINIKIIDEINENEWSFWEKHYISLFKSWGFKLKNKNDGGGGPLTHTNKTRQKLKIANSKPKPEGFGENVSKRLLGNKQSKETKLKRNLKLKGLKRNKIQRKRISKGLKNHPSLKNPERGIKISKINKGRKNPKTQIWVDKYKKPIVQFDLQGNFIKEWKGATDATKELGLNFSRISGCCRNKINKTCGKFLWKFKKDWDGKKIKPYKNIILQLDKQENVIKEWNNVKEAANFLKKHIAGINSCLKGTQKSAFGFKWKYK